MLATLVVTLAIGASATTPEEYQEAFSNYVLKFSKTYANAQERSLKFENFKKTYDYIHTENSKGHNYTLGLNLFSDVSREEFASTHFGFVKPKKPWGGLKHLGTHVYDGSPLEDSVDWRSQGAVTPVKNQGNCGSCWAFSATGALEGAMKIFIPGGLVAFSEEMLVDCSTNGGNSGCKGGNLDAAFDYMKTNGLCTEDTYAYTAGGGQAGACRASSCANILFHGVLQGWTDVQRDNEQALMSAVQQQPVSVVVEADQDIFKNYQSGVMTGPCGTNTDHAILVVGYGVDMILKYWLVKNSWGTGWGLSGYAEIGRYYSECGILSGASYPNVLHHTELDIIQPEINV